MITNLDTWLTVAQNEKRAESFISRFLGLMGRKRFPEACDALIFKRCSSIHCFFMRMEIDVVFINRHGRVVKIFSRLKPWRVAFGGPQSRDVIELPAGTLERTRTKPGHHLKFD